MQIRIRETGQVMFESEFRSLFPDTSFPQQLSEQSLNDFGADVVFEGPQATPTRYQIAFRDGVEEIDGQWFTKYSVADMEQQAADALDNQQKAAIREERNKRLAETDWRFRSDMTPSQAWKDYCQSLRDVTTQEGFPWDIQWPEKPV
jgi:hypothetical protein